MPVQLNRSVRGFRLLHQHYVSLLSPVKIISIFCLHARILILRALYSLSLCAEKVIMPRGFRSRLFLTWQSAFERSDSNQSNDVDFKIEHLTCCLHT